MRVCQSGPVAFPGDDAIMRKDGNKLIIEAAPRSLLAVLATLEPLGEEFPTIRDDKPDEVVV